METIGKKEVKRVGAFLLKNYDTILFLGYGELVGEEIPVEAVGWIADCLKKERVKNPKIVLDDGNVVYGCECWWVAEEKMKHVIRGAPKVEKVNINNIRKNLIEREK